ncbi:4-(cytidine 5'-diphospho)-2-C-methyl-D-erythritol kinase [Vallicoccus soli]|uniref:4-diphosphocytidyl-2-C-methyl-D-erythritol kinase n=1 Tax=Vallicoccus soli TaxID=2339232 RepID=A0A3A3ZMG8_9ACTN|nr:4-(cytidine 5'-diphospho)-2-C-methyl-D-erythritol kinase [Vallicoccus soli]RJK97855.1 4-(cytidine 5'-diphospho)-2-C-methyl-D-erythritol kinase [Vallicoccus soli]
MVRDGSVTVRVPAKVNLQLAVGAARPDGYHELVSVFHAVSLHDDVTVAPSDALRVVVEGEEAAGVPADETNLAARAVLLLAGRLGREADVLVHLRKGIPAAGGMAGGSADAAGALLAADALWGAGLERAELLELAAELGSDVPFALVGGTAVGLGRGERLTPALARGHFEWVLALAEEGLSTPAVYAEADRLRAGRVLPEPRPSERLMAALRAGDPVALARALENDLQPAAASLAPGLHATLQAGEDGGALGGVVSGSGPTCAFLAADAEAADELAGALLDSGTCRAVRRAHGPVAGARVVEGGAREGRGQ